MILLIWFIGAITMFILFIKDKRPHGITLKQLCGFMALSLMSWVLFLFLVLKGICEWVKKNWNNEIIW